MSRVPVTCVMPVKNGMLHIRKAIKVLIESTSQSDQIIVVDDGSQDGTFEFLSKQVSKLDNFFILRNPGEGIVSALNYGIQVAENSWIVRYDVDDEYRNDRIDIQMNVLDRETCAVFSDYIFVDSGGRNLGYVPSAVFSPLVSISLIRNQRTAHPSAIFSKEAFLQVGQYREQDYLVEDLSLWLRLRRIGNMVSVPFPLVKYQISQTSTSSKNRSRMLLEKKKILASQKWQSHELEKAIEILLRSKLYEELSYGSERSILAKLELLAVLRFTSLSSYKCVTDVLGLVRSVGGSELAAFKRLLEDREKRVKFRHKLKLQTIFPSLI